MGLICLAFLRPLALASQATPSLSHLSHIEEVEVLKWQRAFALVHCRQARCLRGGLIGRSGGVRSMSMVWNGIVGDGRIRGRKFRT